MAEEKKDTLRECILTEGEVYKCLEKQKLEEMPWEIFFSEIEWRRDAGGLGESRAYYKSKKPLRQITYVSFTADESCIWDIYPEIDSISTSEGWCKFNKSLLKGEQGF